MKLASKMMAVAILALAAGSVSAATTIAPTSTAAGGAAFVLTVTSDTPGTFDNTSGIDFGTFSLAGVTVNGTNDQLTGTVPAAQILTAKTVTVSVTGTGAGAAGTFYVTDDTLDVTINVDVVVPIQIVFVNTVPAEVGALAWNLSNKSLATTYTSGAGPDALQVVVRNKGGAAVKIQARVATTTNWSLEQQTGATSGLNFFWINANAVELTNVAQDLIPAINPGADSANTVLTLRTPATVSSVTSGDIVVRFTATNN